MRLDAGKIFATIAREAEAESPLWSAALRAPDRWETELVFSPLGHERFALATESIYEGYLLHYGEPRLFAPQDDDTAVLLGDYLYAHGLVRLSGHGDVTAVSDLAELISLCTQLRAEVPRGRSDAADGIAWAATAALLGADNGRLETARAMLRLEGDPASLEWLASQSVGEESLRRALQAHAIRVK